MTTYVIVAAVSGIVFGVLDALINANPLARRLYRVYEPLARTSLNPALGFAIDIAFGFAMAGAFLLLYSSLPGSSGLVKGVSYAAIVWFFRVVMSAASQWMMFRVPGPTLLYSLAAGLGEMLILGIMYGMTLTPIA